MTICRSCGKRMFSLSHICRDCELLDFYNGGNCKTVGHILGEQPIIAVATNMGPETVAPAATLPPSQSLTDVTKREDGQTVAPTDGRGGWIFGRGGEMKNQDLDDYMKTRKRKPQPKHPVMRVLYAPSYWLWCVTFLIGLCVPPRRAAAVAFRKTLNMVADRRLVSEL